VRAVIAQASLPEDMLDVPQLRLSALQYARLYDVFRRAIDDEVFGFFQRKVPVGAYATLLELLTRCSTVADALDAAASFYRLFDRHDHLHLEATDPACIALSPRDEHQSGSIFFVHTMLLSIWRTLLWLADQRVPLRAMRLDRRFESLSAETRFLFGAEPELTRGENAILFDARVLDLPVVRRPEDAAAYAASSLIQMLGHAPEETLQSQLRAILSAERPIASSSLGEVAERLGISRQTLSRRLQERGLSFQSLKDELRRDHAIALLTGSDRSIADIAELLGYSEPSAFSRAFRSWTGVAPGRYR
jgi:AraC-like DNA-binding protein